MPQRWTNARLNKVRYDVKKFFRAYYSELRKQTAVNAEAVPNWLKGGRRVVTYFCEDGVVVAHKPYDEEFMTFPEKEDSFTFHEVPNVSVKQALARYNPLLSDGTRMSPLIPDYAPGEDFGASYWAEPRQRITPWEAEGRQMIEQMKWTRIDYASMNKLDVWRDVSRAREQARYVLRPYLRRG